MLEVTRVLTCDSCCLSIYKIAKGKTLVEGIKDARKNGWSCRPRAVFKGQKKIWTDLCPLCYQATLKRRKTLSKETLPCQTLP